MDRGSCTGVRVQDHPQERNARKQNEEALQIAAKKKEKQKPKEKRKDVPM